HPRARNCARDRLSHQERSPNEARPDCHRELFGPRRQRCRSSDGGVRPEGEIEMRSMTGYGRGETDHNGTKFSVELNSVNRKQSDIVINLPRDLAELEPRIRQTINENISRGRTNVSVTLHSGPNGSRKLALDTELARSYHDAMRTLQKELSAPGEITIGTILQAPGVMRLPEETIDPGSAWPAIEKALRAALGDLIRMREQEGKHLAKDLIP